MWRRHEIMSPAEGGEGAGAGGSAGGEASGAAAPPAAAAASSDAKVDPKLDLRARLADASAKKQSKIDELQKALEDQSKLTTELQRKFDELSGQLKTERDGAQVAARRSKLVDALNAAQVKPKFHSFALKELDGLDLSKDGWEAKVDEFARANPETLTPQQRSEVQSNWAEASQKALGDRLGKTLLGSMDRDQIAALHSRRGL